jgi:hypothetical protein
MHYLPIRTLRKPGASAKLRVAAAIDIALAPALLAWASCLIVAWLLINTAQLMINKAAESLCRAIKLINIGVDPLTRRAFRKEWRR